MICMMKCSYYWQHIGVFEGLPLNQIEIDIITKVGNDIKGKAHNSNELVQWFYLMISKYNIPSYKHIDAWNYFVTVLN